MLVTLQDAINKDLDNFSCQTNNKYDARKAYIAGILDMVLYKNIKNNSYVGMYCQGKTFDEVIQEMQSMKIENIKNYLNITDIFDAVAGYCANEYDYVPDFNAVVKKTIDYNTPKDSYSKDEIKKMINKVVQELLFYGNTKIFNSKNGTKNYVMKNNLGNIVDEMKNYLGITDFAAMDDLIEQFSEVYSSSYLNGKTDNNALSSELNLNIIIKQKVSKLNVNENHKNYLYQKIDNEEYDELVISGLMTQEELDSYLEKYNKKGAY